MKPALLPGLLLGALLASCAGPAGSSGQESPTLIVFAAASLTDAFTELESGFEASHAGVEVRTNFAGSQTLRTQIETGAPADVFASANEAEMTRLVSGGLVSEGTPRIFATNQLVVIMPPSNPADLESLEDLRRPGTKLVLAAEDVPVGRYTHQSLDIMNAAFGSDFEAAVLGNVVSNEDSVRQIVAKVQLGEADAGIVYTSDTVAAPDLKKIEIPPGLNVVARYPSAVLSESAHDTLAADFVNYVLSPPGQAVLKNWGFGSPE
jgi:molybdate transport system substrate-binding protein